MLKRFSVSLALVAAFTGFTGTVAFAQGNRAHGVDLSSVDRTVKPGADFYQFANGGWLAAHAEIPADRTGVGAFNDLSDRNEAILRRLVEEAATDKKAKKNSPRAQVGRFYRVGLDEERAERLGASPLEPHLKRIASIDSPATLMETIAVLHRHGVSAAFRTGIGPDDRDSRHIIVQVGQGGLGMPDRDYYLSDAPQYTAQREKYQEHVARLLALAGDSTDEAKSGAEAVLRIETRLAKASLTRVAMRDPEASYHKMPLAGLEAMSPNPDWDTYFATFGVKDASELGDMNVAQPAFFQELSALVKETPLADWKRYLRAHVVEDASPYLSQAFVRENFAYNQSFTGQKEQAPRWRRVLQSTNGSLNQAVGQLYIAEAFSPEARDRATQLVKSLQAVLRERIGQLDWMGDATKKAAVQKLDALTIKVGYPNKWRDYSKLEVGDDSYYANAQRGAEFNFLYQLSKLGKPADRSEFRMPVFIVNASYSPNENAITIPAGILQPPFFDALADDASNYGAIGAVIGHEMTHGFDDQGRRYDADGNLRDWWTPEDTQRFAARGTALARQYDSYVAIDDLHVNGNLTLGENIADLGGLTLAYQAFEKTRAGKPSEKDANGFTPEQRFFLSFGQLWRSRFTSERSRLLVKVDPHSPNRWRVLGTLANIPAFWQAFQADDSGVTPPSGETTVHIW